MTNGLLIEGGEALSGKVKISGSKNALLPCLAGSVLTSEMITLKNIPLIEDLHTMRRVLESLNIETVLNAEDRILTVSASSPESEIPEYHSGLLRGSVMLLGGLLARTGHVKICGYGGCRIGERPIDLHLNALNLMGAKVVTNGKVVELSARRLKGARIDLRYPSVGATVNIMIAACLAEGETTITNVAIEPEILDLMHLLQSMGAIIEVEPEKRMMRIDGSSDFGSTVHGIIPDRIEAETYAVAAAITEGDLLLEGVNAAHLDAVLDKLREAGVHAELEGANKLRVCMPNRSMNGVNIQTKPYPGFPTDMHPQFASLAIRAHGQSHIVENIYESRFGYVKELRKMGAMIEVVEGAVLVDGPTDIHAASVMAPDLRGGAALILAALAADGVSSIHGMNNVDRGYETIGKKLRSVGAKVERFQG